MAGRGDGPRIWRSPLSAGAAAEASLRFGAVAAGPDGPVWIEERPAERGRGAIVRERRGGGCEDLLPPPFSARSRVHEYGGGALHVAGGDIFFVNHHDQQVYRLRAGGRPVRLVRRATMRFADLCHDAARGRLIAVAERHRKGAEPENLLVAFETNGRARGRLIGIAGGADFYATPRISPDGRWLCWLEWNLPFMPWEAAALKVAPLGADGLPGAAVTVAGGETGAAFQPEWSADGTLHYVAEGEEWSSLHCWKEGAVRLLFAPEAELLRPLWAFGQSSYALLGDGRIAALPVRDGEQELWLVEAGSGRAVRLDMPHRALDQVAAGADGALYAVAADDADMPSVVEMRLEGTRPVWRTLARPAQMPLSRDEISTGRAMSFEAGDGRTVNGLYYPPCNPACEAGRPPPMIVLAHGGPTGLATRGLQLKVQFWTSRGFAILDVDYSGSTGYGRSYREALQGRWGVRDADDVIAAARAAAGMGLADPGRLVVSGRSAGGFTALCVLMRSDLFRAASVHYAVADLETLLDTTHKFEAGYLYGLTGTRPGATETIFRERSPLANPQRINAPVIFLQGDEDKVVPPQQARDIVAVLRERGVPVAYLEFEGEGHGFRQAATIRSAFEAELSFLARVLGLASQEPLMDFDIWNLDGAQ